jgi:glucose repression regulatory protein TUP1
MKKEGSDWFAVFNPNVARTLDVNLVHTLDHNSVVCCARFSADGKFLATGCNRAANIFDVKTGQKVTVLEDTDASTDGDLYIRSVAFSPDGSQLATGAEDKVIRVWDIVSKKVRHVFTGHEQDIYSLDFSKNGRFVASGSGDRTARVWDLEGGRQVLTLSIEDGVTTVAISPDGNYIAAGSLDKVVRVWDAKTGYLVERLEGHKDSVYSVAFSPNGKDLYSGSLDKTVKLWELSAPRGIPASSTPKGGVCRMDFAGHKDFVLSVAPSPDGQWLISGSKDRSVHFWDPRSAQVQLLLQGHKNSVISVSASPQGHLFATGSGDCKARIWSYETLQ